MLGVLTLGLAFRVALASAYIHWPGFEGASDEPPHRRPCQRTPVDTSVHVGVHSNGGKKLGGRYQPESWGLGIGLVVDSTCPNAFSTLGGSRDGG